MAPTEVLAEQHHQTITALLADFAVPAPDRLTGERPLRVELLTGGRGAAGRRRAAQGLAAGGVDIAVGTHALISEGVDFRALGVVVIDEQHRFGVEQRARAARPRPGFGHPGSAGDDGHAHPAHRGHDRLRRPRRVGARRAPRRPPPGGHFLGAHAAGGGPGLGGGTGRGRRRSPGLRGLPCDRGVRDPRRALGDRHPRASDRPGRRTRRPEGRPAARPGEPGPEGGHHGSCSARARWRCWCPPPSSRWGWTCPTPP